MYFLFYVVRLHCTSNIGNLGSCVQCFSQIFNKHVVIHCIRRLYTNRCPKLSTSNIHPIEAIFFKYYHFLYYFLFFTVYIKIKKKKNSYQRLSKHNLN